MKYGFIGCGNMGGAVLRAVQKVTKDIMISDRSGKGRALAQELDIVYGSNAAIARQCDAIFLCVKPHMMADCLLPLQEVLAARKPLLITMAAGLSIRRIEEMAGAALPVIRIMPNTPTAIGKGVIPYCRNEGVEDGVLASWLEDMRCCGMLDSLEEGLMDAVSALSGSGPAYAFVMLEAMADGAVACGIPRAKALQYAAMTLSGAAEMYLQSGTHPGQLKDAVCSPAGSTIQGILELEKNGFRAAVMECILAAYKRNIELGK